MDGCEFCPDGHVAEKSVDCEFCGSSLYMFSTSPNDDASTCEFDVLPPAILGTVLFLILLFTVFMVLVFQLWQRRHAEELKMLGISLHYILHMFENEARDNMKMVAWRVNPSDGAAY